MQERRGIDYATLVFQAMEQRAFRTCFGKIVDRIDTCFPSLGFREHGSATHFERVFRHDVGIRLEMTEPTSDFPRNAGCICLTLPGSYFYLNQPAEMADSFCYLSSLKNFQRFTRLDFCNTELEPEVDTETMMKMLLDKQTWVKGQSTWRPWADRDADGRLPNGLTIYWGSARSEKKGRSYDKGKQTESWTLPAHRDEVETRGRWAQSHGEHLKRELDGCMTPGERLKVMEQNATFALRQHLMYYELGKTLPPDKNWIRDAKPADWYVKRIGKEARPITKVPTQKLDLERAVESGIRQYGRTFYRYAFEQTRRTGAQWDEVLAVLFARMQATLTEDDIAWLAPGGTEDDRKEWIAHLKAVKDDVAVGNEHGWEPGSSE